MTEHRTGAGQPSRTLELLWRRAGALSAPRRGPGRSVDVGDVIDAAVALADESGLRAVTMRAVAQRVGVSTMSVYTYVPGKAELLDLMIDTLYLRMERPPWPHRTWRKRVTRIAEANLELLTAHPWLTEVAALSRPPLGPGLMAKYEYELHAFDGTDLDDVDRDACLTFVLGFVQAHARAAHDADRATTDSAISDSSWWAANQPILEHVLNADRYPLATRVGAAAGEAQDAAWHAERAWSFGLARVLDGLSALISAG